MAATDTSAAGGDHLAADETIARFERLGPDPACLPATPGTYALVLRLAQPAEIVVGALGTRRLPSGLYVYCGSALGPGGLRARVGRHLRVEKRRRWHVDYLRAAMSVEDVLVRESAERLECALADALAARPGASRPIPGFGASDCGCPGHLVRMLERASIISPDQAREDMLLVANRWNERGPKRGSRQRKEFDDGEGDRSADVRAPGYRADACGDGA